MLLSFFFYFENPY